MANETTTTAEATTTAAVPAAVETAVETKTTPSSETPAAVETPTVTATPETKQTETPAVPAKVVPEKYELKLTEGSLLDQSHVDDVASYAKKLGLSNEDAQGLLDRENQVAASFIQKQKETLEQNAVKWVEAVKADSELGGDKFNENVELAKRVIVRFGSDGFKKNWITPDWGITQN